MTTRPEVSSTGALTLELACCLGDALGRGGVLCPSRMLAAWSRSGGPDEQQGVTRPRGRGVWPAQREPAPPLPSRWAPVVLDVGTRSLEPSLLLSFLGGGPDPGWLGEDRELQLCRAVSAQLPSCFLQLVGSSVIILCGCV